MAKTPNPLVKELYDNLKQRNVSVPEFSDLTGIPKDRIYKWKQQGTTLKTQDEQRVRAWLSGEITDIYPKNVPHGNNGKEAPLKPEAQKEGENLMQILANLSESHKNLTAAHKEVAESNNKLADNEKMILARMPIANDGPETISNVLATIVGLQEFVTELAAEVKKTSVDEAAAGLGIKMVNAKKSLGKKGNAFGAGK